jgi:hypothetical protein
MSVAHPELAARASALCDRAEALAWRGPDIYDALWGRWPRFLVAGKRRRQALIQLHARSPLDLRRLYRRTHPRLAKALALYGSTRTRLHRLSGSDEQSRGARAALDLLVADRTTGCDGWGYPFGMQTRWSYYPANSPNVVVTAFAALALEEAGRALSEGRYIDRAAQAARWIQDRLFLPDSGIYAYHEDSRTLVHNANLLGARVVHRLLDDEDARDAVRRAVERTLAAQRPDGSFPYGDEPRLGFVDSFHTGFVLECLGEMRDTHSAVPDALARGATYWREGFFGPEGEARLWPDRAYPEDGHSTGTALTTMSALHRLGLVPIEELARVAARAQTHMLRDGHAVYRRYRLGAARVTYLRWADGHLALGLANAAQALAGVPAAPLGERDS